MLERSRVGVEKRDFTPRNEIIPGRFNIILDFKAVVPENSYVFVGGMSHEIGTWLSSIEGKIYEHVKNLRPIDEKTIKDVFSELFSRPRYTVTQFLRYNKTYAIPGSSLKGAIRSRIEYKLKPFKVGADYRSFSCYIVQEHLSRKTHGHIEFWGKDVVYSRDTCSPPKVCSVCDLFGCPSLSSRVHISDALMVAGDVEYIKELNREAATPNSEFRLSVSILNSDLLDLGLLFLGMEVFTSTPILIGAFKYRFNKKVGLEKLRNKYFAGLLKFELLSFKNLFGDFPSNIDNNLTLIKIAREELLKKYDENYIDFQRGVLS